MTLDAYELCPGGTGKRIKHCACKDIIGDLEKIVRSIEGNQRIAALDRINRTMATKAHRPCLLALKAITLLGMNDLRDFEETVATFVKVAPANPLALAFATVMELRKDRVRPAVDRLQDALAAADKVFPIHLVEAVGMVGQTLALKGDYLAARGHLFFRVLLGKQDEGAVQELAAVNSVQGVPATLKFHLFFTPAPADVSWKTRFASVSKLCARGCWRKGLEGLERLNQEIPGQPVILRNIAMARSYLAHPQTADAWRDYARLPSVPEGDAVEAEAVAQTLDYRTVRQTTPIVKWVFTVADAAALIERLATATHFVAWPDNAVKPNSDEGPPPKAAFSVVDPPWPASGEELSLENTPRVLGEALVYGRETDREARLEIVLPKDERLERVRALVTEAAAERVASDPSEELVDTHDTWSLALHPQLRFPPDTPQRVRLSITRELQRRAVTEVWPTLPLSELDNRTPREVASDAGYRVRLLAALLTLEQQLELEGTPTDCDVVREQLGLPARGVIDPRDRNVVQLNPVHWSRVDPARLDDDRLLELWGVATNYGLSLALWNLGREILDRSSLGDRIDRERLCGQLGQLAMQLNELDQAFAYVKQAQGAARAAGHSPAPWLLREMEMQLAVGNGAAAVQLIEQIKTQYEREPEVMRILVQTLVRWGLIVPEGGAPSAPPDSGRGAAPDRQLWTPGGADSDSAGQPERKLWVPD
jgi:hypothetical protein